MKVWGLGFGFRVRGLGFRVPARGHGRVRRELWGLAGVCVSKHWGSLFRISDKKGDIYSEIETADPHVWKLLLKPLT